MRLTFLLLEQELFALGKLFKAARDVAVLVLHLFQDLEVGGHAASKRAGGDGNENVLDCVRVELELKSSQR